MSSRRRDVDSKMSRSAAIYQLGAHELSWTIKRSIESDATPFPNTHAATAVLDWLEARGFLNLDAWIKKWCPPQHSYGKIDPSEDRK